MPSIELEGPEAQYLFRALQDWLANSKGISKESRQKLAGMLKPYLIVDRQVKDLEDYINLSQNVGEMKKNTLFARWDEVVGVLERGGLDRLKVWALARKGDFYFHYHEIDKALFEYRKAVTRRGVNMA